MKRILALSFILLVFTVNAISQETENSCSHKDLIRDFVSLADSFSRFIHDTKTSVSEAEWERFIEGLGNGEGEKAFEHLGNSSEPVKAIFTDLGNQLVEQQQKLSEAIKTDEKITDEEVNEIIDREIYCYFSDTVENNLPKLLAATGRLAPMELGNLDPCDDLYICLRASAQAFNTAINNCISAALGGGGLFGWLGALLVGGGCLANASIAHNNANYRCIAKYYKACYGD